MSSLPLFDSEALGDLILVVPLCSLFVPLSAWAAREWADAAVMWYGYELGKDSEYVQEMMDVIKSPRTQRAWGTRRDQSVGGPLKKT